MRVRSGASLTLTAALALLAGCADLREPTVAPEPGPPARTSWTLRHRVVESADLHVVSHGIGRYEESTGVSLGQSGDESCYVTVSVPGQGGPELMTGEKVATTFRGRTAFRNGAGAEAAYLAWQLVDTSWVQVTCDGPEDREPVDVVAAAVRLKASSVALPIGLTELPAGYGVSEVRQDRQRGGATIYVGRLDPADLGDSTLEISYEPRDPLRQPSGRAVTVAGHPALLDEEPTSPEVCVSVQQRNVCVGVPGNDTGPYPDRSDDVPTLLALASHLRYAEDLDDRSTWFAAEKVLG